MDRPAGGRDEVLRALAALSRERLSAAFDALLGACRTRFFEQARTAAGEDEQKRCLDFVRELTRARAAMTESFLRRMEAGFAALPPHPAAPLGAMREAELPLVESVDAAQLRYRTDLLQLRQRLGRVLGQDLDPLGNPLDPARIAAAFVESIAALVAGRELLVRFCGQFDAHVLQTLEGLYRQANRLLEDAVPPSAPLGSSPAPQRSDTRGEEAEGWLDAYFRTGADTTYSEPSTMSAAAAALFAAGRHAGAPPTDAAAAHAAPESPRVAAVAGSDALRDLQEISGLLQRLRGGVATAQTLAVQPLPVAGRAGVPASAGAAPDPMPVTTLSGEALVALLGELQAGSGAAPGGCAGAPAVAVDIRTAIGAIAASRGNVGVGRQDQDVLDVVTLFFDLVTEDRALPQVIQGLIARLQLPVLKLALLDRAFFSDRAHPARQLIDAIARAGVGFDASSRESQDSLLVQLGALVDELLAGTAPGAEGFALALGKLNDYLSRAEQRAQKLERRNAEKAQAEARTAAARDAVHALLSERLDGRELPQPVLEFITRDWQRVLQLFYLRKGQDSTEWRDAVLLVEELVRTAVRPADPAGREALEEALPDLYRRLAAGLEMTQGNTGEAQERIGMLREMHRACVVAPAGPAPAAVTPVARVKIEPPPLIPPRNPRPAAGAPESAGAALTLESLKRVDELALGTWFEYENPANRATRRLKLSARIEETRVFLFCDHLGHAVAEKPRKQFALELQSGHLRVIEDTPLVDRTIERITASLRARAEG